MCLDFDSNMKRHFHTHILPSKNKCPDVKQRLFQLVSYRPPHPSPPPPFLKMISITQPVASVTIESLNIFPSKHHALCCCINGPLMQPTFLMEQQCPFKTVKVRASSIGEQFKETSNMHVQIHFLRRHIHNPCCGNNVTRCHAHTSSTYHTCRTLASLCYKSTNL